MSIVTVNDLSKQFVKTIKPPAEKKGIFGKNSKPTKVEFYAVNNMSFTVEQGDVFGILGPNGAGKTTLLRMLAGIMTPTGGSITIDGKDVETQKNQAKEVIGFLSGNTKLYARLSPRELLYAFGTLYGLEKEQILKRIEQIFQMLDMQEFGDNRIENLSTGQTQRVSISRCLIHSPKLYIFDEPTLGLDVLSSRSIIEFIKQESGLGKSIIYSTHYMEEAQSLCNKILMMHKGQIIASGSPEELMGKTGTNNLRDSFINLLGVEEEVSAV